MSREHTEACTRAAFEAGITFFDTANVYGRGAAEEAWGEILSAYPRDSYVLATKLFWPMADGHAGGLSAAEVHTQIDASLARLRTDYVDLYQCHRFDIETPIEETMEALSEVVRAGKARWIGFSEWTPEQIRAALDVVGSEKFVSSQPQYNLLWRGPEREVFGLCAANGIGQIVWSPLAQGVLTGKYVPGQAPPPGSRAADAEHGPVRGALAARAGPGGGAAAASRRRAGRPLAGPSGAGLGAAPQRGRLGDRRRLAPGAGARQRAGVRR